MHIRFGHYLNLFDFGMYDEIFNCLASKQYPIMLVCYLVNVGVVCDTYLQKNNFRNITMNLKLP